jgi:hypothetical protein
MRRKVVKQGKSTLTIALPFRWVQSRNLEAGDELEINEVESDLLLSASNKTLQKIARVKADKLSKNQLRSIVASLYKSGYGTIILSSKSDHNVKDMNEIVRSFTGLEMFLEADNEIHIKSFINCKKDEVDSLILKLIQISIFMTDELEKKYKKIKVESMKELGRNNTIQIRDHCLRTIHLNVYKGDQSYDYYDLVTTLEKLNAEILYLAETIKNEKIEESQLFQEIKELVNKFYTAFMRKQYNTSLEFYNSVYSSSPHKPSKDRLKVLKNENILLVMHHYRVIKCLRRLSSRLISISANI